MAAPRRVLLVSFWLEAGGSERQLTEVAKRLNRARFEPRVGCIRKQGLCAEELREAGVPVVDFPMRGFLRPSYWRAARDLRRYIRRERIDIVHAFDVPGTLFAIPVARAARAPVAIASQRAYRDLTPGKHPFLRITDRIADGIVVNSEAVRDTLIQQDRVPPERLHLCGNGLDLNVFYRARERRPGALRIGAVARLRREKGLETLIDAFAAVREDSPEIELTIVGSGELLEELKQRAGDRKSAGAVHFEPATRAVAEWLRSFDIFVLPSLSEALSNALMEAMACGCCAIASRVGGNPELVEDGVSGLLFAPGDASDLARKLRAAMRDPAMRARLAAAGESRMREQYSIEAAVRRMEEIYDRLATLH